MKYKIVGKEWRSAVTPFVRKKFRARNRKQTDFPILDEIMAGKTVFAWDVEDRKVYTHFYRYVRMRGRLLHIHQYADIDNDIMNGYLMWASKIGEEDIA